MKKIPKQKIMSRKTKESIKLERNILAASTNRFITALRYAFLDKKYLYIVMEVASAGDASRLIQNHKIRE
jgi:serine/threonine protein kinase